MKWVHLCDSLKVLCHCPFWGLEWKLTFSSSVATAEFSKFAGTLSAAFSQHHPLEFEIAQVKFSMHTDGSQSECFWEEQDSLWPGIIPTFDSKETFSACVVSLFLDSDRVFASLCPCQDYFLEVFTRDKDWLFTLFLLLLPFWRTNWRLIINSLVEPSYLLPQEMQRGDWPIVKFQPRACLLPIALPGGFANTELPFI